MYRSNGAVALASGPLTITTNYNAQILGDAFSPPSLSHYASQMQTTTDDSVIGDTVITTPPAPMTPGSPTRRKRSISVEIVSDRPSKQRAVRQVVPSVTGAIEKPSADFKPCPFTHEFFRDVAHTIANTFPFESFARAQDCGLQDVAHAISAVVLAPLRRPHLLLEGNLSVSEYSQVLIAEWRARQKEKRVICSRSMLVASADTTGSLALPWTRPNPRSQMAPEIGRTSRTSSR